jgi:hypothetical protein
LCRNDSTKKAKFKSNPNDYGWDEPWLGWTVFSHGKGYHGNLPPLYAVSRPPNQKAWEYDPNFHLWLKVTPVLQDYIIELSRSGGRILW